MKTPKITVAATINAPAAKVWEAWTTPAHIRKWNAASDDWHSPSVQNDLRVGGKFSTRMEAKDGSDGFDFEGEYTEIRTGERIAYTIADGREVVVEFETADDGTKVIETFVAESENPIEMQRAGWQSILDNFKRHVESRSDRDRSTLRPMQKITPFLAFDGQAEEAARFYVSLLPDSRIDRVTHSPLDTPAAKADTVLLVEFTLAGSSFIALNTPGFSFTEAVSFTIASQDQAETDRLWAALTADGGSEVACGWLKDRWGVFWQITPTRLMELIGDSDRDRARRAMEAMMTMIKIDIAAVERAADGAEAAK